MKKQLLLSVALMSAAWCSAQEVARVISSTPIVQQVAVPRQVCSVDPAQGQNVQRCQMQTFYENSSVAYNVVYEFAGKQYTVQMPNDPGPSIRLQIVPVGVTTQTQMPATVTTDVNAQTVYVQPSNVVLAPVGAVYYDYYGPYYPVYPLIGLSLGFRNWGGFRSGGHHHWH
jgi:hypothetical protein